MLCCRTDDKWHHIAVTWKWESGETHVYFDGQSQTPFWRSQASSLSVKDPKEGGVDTHIASQTARHDTGALLGLLLRFAASQQHQTAH